MYARVHVGQLMRSFVASGCAREKDRERELLLSASFALAQEACVCVCLRMDLYFLSFSSGFIAVLMAHFFLYDESVDFN